MRQFSFSNKKIHSIFDEEDVLGNKVFHVSRLGMHTNLRYTLYNKFIFINVYDLLDVFHPDNDPETTWSLTPMEVKTQLYFHEHHFKQENEKPVTQLETLCLSHTDCVKLLAFIPLDTTVRCHMLELFLIHYHLKFESTVLQEKSFRFKWCTDGFFYQVLLFMFVLGFGICALILWLTKSIKQ